MLIFTIFLFIKGMGISISESFVNNKDSNVKLLVNSRNVGASKSIFLGLKESSGSAVIPMYAADLQDPVDIIYDFYNEWRKGF